jgi:hypothetical protein
MPFGLDLMSVIVGIILGMFVIPMLTSVVFGALGGGRQAAAPAGGM